MKGPRRTIGIARAVSWWRRRWTLQQMKPISSYWLEQRTTTSWSLERNRCGMITNRFVKGRSLLALLVLSPQLCGFFCPSFIWSVRVAFAWQAKTRRQTMYVVNTNFLAHFHSFLARRNKLVTDQNEQYKCIFAQINFLNLFFANRETLKPACTSKEKLDARR